MFATYLVLSHNLDRILQPHMRTLIGGMFSTRFCIVCIRDTDSFVRLGRKKHGHKNPILFARNAG